MLLDKIEKANDIKKIDKSDYGELAEEIRQFLIEKISVTALPFAIASTVAIFIIALFPQIALWLPAVLGY